jgi:hypothetical protein
VFNGCIPWQRAYFEKAQQPMRRANEYKKLLEV